MCVETKGCRIGTPKTGNFRGVCPFNRAKGVHRSISVAITELRWDSIFRNLSMPKKEARANFAFFGRVEKHTGRCCGDACLAKTRPADGSLPFIYMGRRRRAKSDKEAKNNGS